MLTGKGKSRMNGPCLDCTERAEKCHVTCEKYKAWKEYDKNLKAWLKRHRYEPSNGMMKSAENNLRARARGWKKKVTKYE